MKPENVVWAAISLVVLYLTWRTVSPLLAPLIMAITLTYILYPVHERLGPRIGNRRSALLLTGFLTVLSFLLILGFTLWINDIKYSLAVYVESFFRWLLGIRLPAGLYATVKRVSLAIVERFNSYVLGYTFSLPKLFLQTIVMLFAFYGTTVKANVIERELYHLIPPGREELAMKLIRSASETLNYLLRGWLLVSFGKGALMALLFYLFGVSNAGGAIAAGILTVVLELLPIFGGWVVWGAAAVYLSRTSPDLAFLMAVLGFSFVSPLPDRLLALAIGKRQWGVNAFVSLVGIFGGYMTFGLVGIIIGPVSLSLLTALLEEWKRG